ncbi:MAG: DinB family protein [Nostocoides sp.]
MRNEDSGEVPDAGPAQNRSTGGVYDDAVETATDENDWTWTLSSRCPDCGFAAGEVPVESISGWIRTATAPWAQVLADPGVRNRPQPQIWSPLEYACHVRDVCRVFDARLALLLDEDDPLFANWDQDEAAIRDHYDQAVPEQVAAEISAAAAALAAAYAAVDGPTWGRRGRRSNGSTFTVATLGQYALHDLVHHAWDVGAGVTPEDHRG